MSDLASAIPELRRPFTPAAVKFKPQSVLGEGKGVLCVAYIDMRLVSERLNHICPNDWSDAYRPVGNGVMWCDLTVHGVTRSDVGEGTGKALVSDALKRAAVKFGVGVSLYAVPELKIWANQGRDLVSIWESGVKQNGKKKYDARIEDAGHAHLVAQYGAWLEQVGRQAFGEPLDHGDVDGAAGDHEVTATEPVHTEPHVPAGIIYEVIAEAKQAVAAGLDLAPLIEAVGAERKSTFPQTVRAMAPAQVEQFRSNLADLKAAA